MRHVLPVMLLAFLGGCGTGAQTYSVPDVTRTTSVTLQKRSGQGAIHAISIVGKGRIEGTGTISLLLNGKPYKTERLSGDVHFQWGGDWYADSAVVEYTPSSVKGGWLKMEYSFSD